MKSEDKKNNKNIDTTQQEESKKESDNNQQEQQEQQKQQEETAQEETQENEGAEEQQPEASEGQDKQKAKEKKKEKKEKKKEKTDKEKLAELQDRYLRLQAEYDNYRKRTLREKMELTRSAGEDILKGLLPVMDDFERGLQSIDEAENAEALKDGVHLIYGKFQEFLRQQGVKAMESQDQEFDTDKHEAISKIPAPSEDMKGKVVDVVQTGYYLNDKVLRFAKVVVGE
ncbi:MAG TPA: nucleotide exchange factor GrpE [Bacteroidales bacterium]|nr:nucleotide exchange factor GrpE [Bacteroidales bacterium]